MADFGGPAGEPRVSPTTHIVGETGLRVQLDGEQLCMTAELTPHLAVPGTDLLRTSVLATWTDVLTGLLATTGIPTGGVPVTLDLSLDVLAPVPCTGTVEGRCAVLKAGRSVVVLGAEFWRPQGALIALATAAFVATPDPRYSLPPLTQSVAGLASPSRQLLQEPLAQRASCARAAPGVAVLERREDGLNAVGNINGALLALLAEEAVLSAAPPGAHLANLALRYLRPARTGPVVATAEGHGALSRVELRDTGQDDRLVITAVTRTA